MRSCSLLTGVDLLTHLGVDGTDLIGPPTQAVCPPSDHLFGGPDRWEDPRDPWFADGKVAIAAGGCGNPGDRALLMRVTVDGEEVVWSNFESYSLEQEFDPTETRRLRDTVLRFDAEQYRSVLASLCPGSDEAAPT